MFPDLLAQIKNSDASQLCKKYNIIVNADGTAYDKCNKKTFNTLVEWVEFKRATQYHSINLQQPSLL